MLNFFSISGSVFARSKPPVRTFARLRVDYSTLRRRISPQIVLGWTPSPGTALYAGYNDDISYRGSNPYTGTLESGFRATGAASSLRLRICSLKVSKEVFVNQYQKETKIPARISV